MLTARLIGAGWLTAVDDEDPVLTEFQAIGEARPWLVVQATADEHRGIVAPSPRH